MERSLRREVWQRAQGRCEYCQLAQIVDPLPFQIDHIIAEQHGGETVSENLALCCLFCNKHKGPNIAGIDPLTGRIARLFNPRRDNWARHFVWNGPILTGRTSTARATIRVLAINHPDNTALREALLENEEFPPSR